ncbi:MAG: glutamate mutase L [bacterium]|nr:glutamate mutase L [bacterium]
MRGEPQHEIVLATDVGSTTTKAVLLEMSDGEWRLAGQAQAPTTVESPTEDVMIGVRNAIRRLEQATGRELLDGGELVRPGQRDRGVDLFVSTSSAGGGLQMAVAGVVRTMSAESAERAALGAGAIVADVISIDDARLIVERIRRVRELRPDMILLSGGTDEGGVSQVAAVAEYIAAAKPTPRFGGTRRVPVIFAGNRRAREYVRDVLEGLVDVYVVDNIRPTLEEENLAPARAEIHRLYLEHVMVQAPGYPDLLRWAEQVVEPTPRAVGRMVELLARDREANVVGLDVGGATTDVFSVTGGRFFRTVSANLGMSYSMANVMAESGPAAVLRWLPFDLEDKVLSNWNANKMIRPTTLPQTLDELMLEHAMAREAIRLSYEHHHTLARGLKGVACRRTLDDVLIQPPPGRPVITPTNVDLVIGSGGVVSHAPRPSQALLLLLDSLQPAGITTFLLDSGFLLPHLGVLALVHPAAATDILWRDCVVALGTVVAPLCRPRDGQLLARVRVTLPAGGVREDRLVGGRLARMDLGPGERAVMEAIPVRGVDVGAGPGRRILREVVGGRVGLVLDGRGRPIRFPADPYAARSRLVKWLAALDAYPAASLAEGGR